MNHQATQPSLKTKTQTADRSDLPSWSMVPFLLIAFCVAWGILALYIFLPDQMSGVFGQLTPLFNASRGSILLTALFHFTVMNPVLPVAEPYDTYILVLVAAVIVWLNRKTMFSRKHGVTVVVPASE